MPLFTTTEGALTEPRLRRAQIQANGVGRYAEFSLLRVLTYATEPDRDVLFVTRHAPSTVYCNTDACVCPFNSLRSVQRISCGFS
jgi:hypothetical protein